MNHRQLSIEKVTACIKNEYLFIGSLVSLVVISTIISSGFSKDSANYNLMFEVYGATGWVGFVTEIYTREVFFLAVSKVLYSLSLSSIYLFLIHSIISISVKFYLIDNHSKDRFLSLAYFCSYFFILHDCTQLRFGMAVAFVYLGLHFLAENRKLLFSAIVVLSAILFHNAIFIFIIMLLFTSKRSLFWLLGSVAISIMLYPVNLNIAMSGLVGGVVDYFGIEGTRINRLYSYLLTPSSEMHLGLFSRHGLLIYVFGAIVFKYRSVFNKFETLCYNAFILSIFFWILLKDSMDIQVRLNDAFGFSLVFLIPYVHRRLSEYVSERNAYVLLILFFSAYLTKFIFYDGMVAL